MKLALECPTDFMSTLLPETDFDFLLTHLALKYPDYISGYQKMKSLGRYSVLDNGTNEQGHPCTIKEIDKVASLVNPDVIVPPDYLGEGERTTQAILECRKIWGHSKILPVLQGSDIQEIETAFQVLRNFGFSTIAVPYDIGIPRASISKVSLNTLGVNRYFTISSLLKRDGAALIHLLGLNNLSEPSWYKKDFPNRIISIDTGAPFTNASMGIRFGQGLLTPKGVFIDYSKRGYDYPEETLSLAKANIKFLKELL